MEDKLLLNIKDTKRIKNIKFKYPELLNNDSEELIKNEYYSILEVQNELYKARDEVRRLEKILKEKQEYFNKKSSLFDIEFEEVTKEYTKNSTNLVLNGKLEYKYKH